MRLDLCRLLLLLLGVVAEVVGCSLRVVQEGRLERGTGAIAQGRVAVLAPRESL